MHVLAFSTEEPHYGLLSCQEVSATKAMHVQEIVKMTRKFGLKAFINNVFLIGLKSNSCLYLQYLLIKVLESAANPQPQSVS